MEALLNPLEPLLDRLFLTGLLYGSWQTLRCCFYTLRSLRNYLLPIGATPVTTERLGEWAGMMDNTHLLYTFIHCTVVTGATTSLGSAFALSVSCHYISMYV